MKELKKENIAEIACCASMVLVAVEVVGKFIWITESNVKDLCTIKARCYCARICSNTKHSSVNVTTRYSRMQNSSTPSS
jgi:hypothetical protein